MFLVARGERDHVEKVTGEGKNYIYNCGVSRVSFSHTGSGQVPGMLVDHCEVPLPLRHISRRVWTGNEEEMYIQDAAVVTGLQLTGFVLAVVGTQFSLRSRVKR